MIYFDALPIFAGTLQNGAAGQYFKDSEIGLFNNMFNYMKARETNVKSSEDGVIRVLCICFYVPYLYFEW